jgi:hypothetical protein
LTQEAGTSAPLGPENRAIAPRAMALVSKALGLGAYFILMDFLLIYLLVGHLIVRGG